MLRRGQRCSLQRMRQQQAALRSRAFDATACRSMHETRAQEKEKKEGEETEGRRREGRRREGLDWQPRQGTSRAT